MDTEDVVYIYNGVFLSHRKEENDTICSNIDEPRDYHANWNKPAREIQISYDITYMWDQKNDTNELIYKADTGFENKFMVTKVETWGGDG